MSKVIDTIDKFIKIFKNLLAFRINEKRKLESNKNFSRFRNLETNRFWHLQM